MPKGDPCATMSPNENVYSLRLTSRTFFLYFIICICIYVYNYKTHLKPPPTLLLNLVIHHNSATLYKTSSTFAKYKRTARSNGRHQIMACGESPPTHPTTTYEQPSSCRQRVYYSALSFTFKRVCNVS